ncbi:hypothetical protein GC197_03535 [bacterium]|nr:hypothetical protein [bacterium]
MSDNMSKVESDREILQEAQAKGAGATLGAWVRLSGPGWLQSAITLGGGSLSGALFLGILGGYSLLWLQLVAIVCGVVMLSAISYVTLSTGERPFQQINTHINPVLGWGWLIATVAANMIFLMPQFALCYSALNKNMAPGLVGDDIRTKAIVSGVLLVAGGILVFMNSRPGLATKIFDILLKAMIAVIVICFFGVVVKLGLSGEAFSWSEVFSGFIPDLSAASEPTGKLAEIASQVEEPYQSFWTTRIVADQRAAMIGAAATAVGINMTFLLPYSMLARGWDKTFRGLARFDLSTGMAIPYILVTSCVVIASAAAFHGKVDPAFLSNSPEEMEKSPVYGGAQKMMAARVLINEDELQIPQKYLDEAKGEDGKTDKAKLAAVLLKEKYPPLMAGIANLPESEKRLAASLVKRSEFLLSQSLAPLLGDSISRWVFGIGVFGMGFSTIIILMMINGYAFSEMLNTKPNGAAHVLGCLLAGLSGASWFVVWDGPAKVWLAILVSSFAVLFLPIAYVTFFMMMNSKSILGEDRPKGISWLIWNVLMIFSVVGAIAAAYVSLSDKLTSPSNSFEQKALVLTVVVGYLILFVGGFFMKKGGSQELPLDSEPTESA